MGKLVSGLLSLYLVCLLAFWFVLRASGDQWWGGTLLLFGPRWLVALPIVILLPLTLATRPRFAWILLLHAAVILFPICGFRLRYPRGVSANPHPEEAIRVLTYNVGGGTLDQSAFSQLLRDQKVDVVMIQECSNGMATEIFGPLGWNYRQWKHLALGTRLEIDQHQEMVENEHDYGAAVALQVTLSRMSTETNADSGSSPRPVLQVVCVHLPTPRHGIEATYRSHPFSFEPIDRINSIRQQLMRRTSEAVQNIQGPVIVAGDFNTPVDSPLFVRSWQSLNNAFDCVGSGFGWTKWTRFFGIRIDHVLHSNHWQAISARVLPALGGDHRPLLVSLVKQP